MEITITIHKNGEIDPPGMLMRTNEPVEGEIDAETEWKYMCEKCAAPVSADANVETILMHDCESRLFWGG